MIVGRGWGCRASSAWSWATPSLPGLRADRPAARPVADDLGPHHQYSHGLVWVGEALTGIELVAMALAVGGTVGGFRKSPEGSSAAGFRHTHHRARTMGILLGLGGALGQAVGLLLSKKGMEGGFSPLSATIMRILVAAVVIRPVTALQGRVRLTWRALEDRTALRFIAGGAFTGPFLGVWASMIAVQNVPVGVAATLMALPPICSPLIPLDLRRACYPAAVAGTLAALSGAALFF